MATFNSSVHIINLICHNEFQHYSNWRKVIATCRVCTAITLPYALGNNNLLNILFFYLWGGQPRSAISLLKLILTAISFSFGFSLGYRQEDFTLVITLGVCCTSVANKLCKVESYRDLSSTRECKVRERGGFIRWIGGLRYWTRSYDLEMGFVSWCGWKIFLGLVNGIYRLYFLGLVIFNKDWLYLTRSVLRRGECACVCFTVQSYK